VLAQDGQPGIFPYFQEFTVPDTGERLVRKGFIALGAVEDYSAGVVHRHEQTLSGPKKDRLELLRHTHAHAGQLFMLYPDPDGLIDALLDEAAALAPIAAVTDEYGAVHSVWRIADAARVQELMADKETAHCRRAPPLRNRAGIPQRESRPAGRRPRDDDVRQHAFAGAEDPGHAPAGERTRSGRSYGPVPAGRRGGLPGGGNRLARRPETGVGRSRDRSVIGAAVGSRLFLLEDRQARGELDVNVLHQRLLAQVLGIGEEAVRDEKHLRYIRGLDAAIEEARKGAAQIAFLLNPVSVEQVAATSFAGGVMPQKSTDFYPKLLSGLTIYRVG